MARQSARVREGTHFPAFDLSAPNSNNAVEAANGSHAPLLALLKRLSEEYGPPGSEERVRALVRDEIKGMVDQVRADALGNLIALRRGAGANRKKVMLAASLDEPGSMVTFVDSRGFCRFSTLGNVPALSLLGARVQFENGTMGVIGREEKGASASEIVADKLFIDVGAASAEASPVRVGDTAVPVREMVEAGDALIGKALSARAGCAVLIETMRQLRKSPHDIYCVFTVQGQVGARGAGTAAYSIQPDIAFVIGSVAARDTPGGDASAVALGKGPVIKFKDETMISSPTARQALLTAARQARLPYQVDAQRRGEGDGTPIQAAREGVPTAALGVPVRYQDTASEMLDRRDVQLAIALLSQLLSKGF